MPSKSKNSRANVGHRPFADEAKAAMPPSAREPNSRAGNGQRLSADKATRDVPSASREQNSRADGQLSAADKAAIRVPETRESSAAGGGQRGVSDKAMAVISPSPLHGHYRVVAHSGHQGNAAAPPNTFAEDGASRAMPLSAAIGGLPASANQIANYTSARVFDGTHPIPDGHLAKLRANNPASDGEAATGLPARAGITVPASDAGPNANECDGHGTRADKAKTGMSHSHRQPNADGSAKNLLPTKARLLDPNRQRRPQQEAAE